MLEPFEFIFWEIVKTVALLVAALLAAKSVRGWAHRGVRWALAQWAMIAVIAALSVVGARAVGEDVAAEIYAWRADRALDGRDFPRAYGDARRAAETRPGVLGYWQLLDGIKIEVSQYGSLASDETAVRALSPRGLASDDLMRFAWARHLRGDDDGALALARELTAREPAFPKAYVLAGYAETGLGRLTDAESDFTRALGLLPGQSDAVRGLAHARFLDGRFDRARAVLDIALGQPFPAEDRQTFNSLKALYEQ